MNAIEKLYAAIAQQFPDERITTKQAADTVGLTRGVTSSYLSKLEKQGKLLKTGAVLCTGKLRGMNLLLMN